MWIYLTLLIHILKDGKIYNMWAFCFVFHLFVELAIQPRKYGLKSITYSYFLLLLDAG